MSNKAKCQISSRKIIVYIVMFLWISFGAFASFYTPKNDKGEPQQKVALTSLAIYFVSLTGFVGSFIYGDTMKTKDWTTPLFMKGENDSRETIVYISILLWLIGGVYGIIYCIGLDQIGAYFAALTPFVAGYILGETQRSSTPLPAAITDAMNNSKIKTNQTQVISTQTNTGTQTTQTTSVSQIDNNASDEDQNENSK